MKEKPPQTDFSELYIYDPADPVECFVVSAYRPPGPYLIGAWDKRTYKILLWTGSSVNWLGESPKYTDSLEDLVSTISHETIHGVLQRLFDREICHKFDRIGHPPYLDLIAIAYPT